MTFATGSLSFSRFSVSSQSPGAIDQELLDKLAAQAFQETEIGLPEEVSYGWGGGDHLYDNTFTFGKNVFADCLVFALRIQTNKVPGDVQRAYTRQQETAVAATNPSGFIGKVQKREIKDVVRRQCEEEVRSGKHRKSRIMPVLWDVPRGIIYSPASGTNFERLAEIFERTFGLSLNRLSAEAIAYRKSDSIGRRDEWEAIRPTRFAEPAEGGSLWPEYPWVAKTVDQKAFLGNEFLLWLWYQTEQIDGRFDTPAGRITVFFDRLLEMDCAYGQSGKDSIKRDGPGRAPEARVSLWAGKVPRKAHLIVDAGGTIFSFTLGAETFAVSSATLPDVDDADTARVVFEERIAMLRHLGAAIDGLYGNFIELRTSPVWDGEVSAIRRWIERRKPTATGAAQNTASAAMSKPLARATKDLASLVGDGLDSITISTPGSKPIVIDAAAADRIRNNCDAIIDGKAAAPASPAAPADAPPDSAAPTPEPEQPTAEGAPFDDAVIDPDTILTAMDRPALLVIQVGQRVGGRWAHDIQAIVNRRKLNVEWEGFAADRSAAARDAYEAVEAWLVSIKDVTARDKPRIAEIREALKAATAPEAVPA